MDFRWFTLFLICLLVIKTDSAQNDIFQIKSQSNESLNFMVIGDWGGLPDFPYRTAIEKAVATGMGKIAASVDSQFTLALGDNFYFDGVKNIHDLRFKDTFEDVFTAKSLHKDWWFVAGNHDWHGNVSAQIEYSKYSSRWNFPQLYYMLQHKLNDGATVDIVMIDTVQLCGQVRHDFLNDQPKGPSLAKDANQPKGPSSAKDANQQWFQPKGPSSAKDANQQWLWIEEKLKNSKADYLFVAGHYPVISIAEHGPTQGLVDRLMPLLHKYNVTAYLCGHEHNLQHLVSSSSEYTVDYFISGAANFIDNSQIHKDSVPKESLKFHWASEYGLGAFSYITLQKNYGLYSFVEANGRLLYRKILNQRRVLK